MLFRGVAMVAVLVSGCGLSSAEGPPTCDAESAIVEVDGHMTSGGAFGYELYDPHSEYDGTLRFEYSEGRVELAFTRPLGPGDWTEAAGVIHVGAGSWISCGKSYGRLDRSDDGFGFTFELSHMSPVNGIFQCVQQEAEAAGCVQLEDRDQDRLLDTRDNCPDDAEDPDGFEDDDGCPDLDDDGDGVPDSVDRCPGEQGNSPDGCWDTDGDGIPDEEDACPDDAGEPPDGCPDTDTDEDGIPDWMDTCPDDAGEPPDGCPDTDTDEDGIPDWMDACPDDAGEPPDGCPDPTWMPTAMVPDLSD